MAAGEGSAAWSPGSWSSLPILQQPVYEDDARVSQVHAPRCLPSLPSSLTPANAALSWGDRLRVRAGRREAEAAAAARPPARGPSLSLLSPSPLSLFSLSLSLSARAHADTTRESARVQVDKLKQLLAEASRGERFLLQGEPAPTALSCSPFPLTLRPSPSPSSSPPSSPSASRSSSPSPSPSPSSSPSSSVSLLARCPPQR